MISLGLCNCTTTQTDKCTYVPCLREIFNTIVQPLYSQDTYTHICIIWQSRSPKNFFRSSGVTHIWTQFTFPLPYASFFLLCTHKHTHGHAHIHSVSHTYILTHTLARAFTHTHIHERYQPTIYRLESWTRLVRSRSKVKQLKNQNNHQSVINVTTRLFRKSRLVLLLQKTSFPFEHT